jgi:hypothetical protein
LEKISATSTTIAKVTRARDSPCGATARAGRLPCGAIWVRRYHSPTWNSTNIATSAQAENQAIAPWPRGITTIAASSGPIAWPALPPTWNRDCARPYLPPEASRATRDDSGWKIDEPMPTSPAENSSIAKLCAWDSSSRPISVEPMPVASENGIGRRSVNSPTIGCSSEAVSWKVSVISPTWAKSSPKLCLNTGYSAGISDCIMSFIMCEKLSAISTG